MAEVPLDVDVDNSEAWHEEWAAILEEAGLKGVDATRFMLWLKERSKPSSGKGARSGVASATLAVLDKHGVVVTDKVVAELETVVKMGDAGDELSQSTCGECVGILYTGEVYQVEDLETWRRLKAGLTPGGGGKINITRFQSYGKLVGKTNLVTLERALKKRELWDTYVVDVPEALDSAGLPRAATRFQRLIAAAWKAAKGS